MSLHEIPARRLDGSERDLTEFRGQVLLIVNVASRCGFTPQYKGLEELNKKYRARGLKILGFPANDFGAQEPGSDAEIKQFCSTNYGVTFDMFSKITVKGDAKNDLYRYLTAGGGNPSLAGEVKWNFQKYLIDRKGNLRWVHRGYKPGDENEYLNQIRALVRE